MANLEDVKNVQPLADFNWDEFENGTNVEVSKEELVKAYDETLNKIQEAQVVEGIVSSIDKKEVVVNIGYKSDGVIPASEFRYNPELKVGDKVQVYVENQEDKRGQLMLSHRKARLQKSWENINKAMENDEVIQGYIKSRTKGGMIVDVFGIEAFLPGSQIDVHPIRDYDVFVGKTMEFKVVKINQEFRNVVVSHKALIEAELEAQRKDIISHLEKGQILEGTVKNITSYGVFVDLGGVDGLIHITDLSWGRVSDPHEVVALDDKINVVILDFDEEKKRIALGLKQLIPHPWDALDANLKVGDEVEAVILTLDREERKMSLGIKQLREDPWEVIEVKYPIGSKHTATVRNFTNFGIFVELEEGVDGLIHVSDLSWTKKVKHPSEFTSQGAQIDVVVLEIDKENRRLSLGHKQLEDNPWDTYETLYTPGSIHEGKITESMDKGAVITLNEGGEGFATPKHLVKEDGTQAQLGEVLPFVVIEFVKDTKRIILSHSRTFEEVKEEQPRRRHANSSRKQQEAQVNNVAAGTSLGDLDVLADLKKKMEEGQ